MVAGFSFIGEFSQMSSNVMYRAAVYKYFSSIVHYPDFTSADFASFLYVLLLQEVLSNQKQASNYHWRNRPI